MQNSIMERGGAADNSAYAEGDDARVRYQELLRFSFAPWRGIARFDAIYLAVKAVYVPDPVDPMKKAAAICVLVLGLAVGLLAGVGEELMVKAVFVAIALVVCAPVAGVLLGLETRRAVRSSAFDEMLRGHGVLPEEMHRNSWRDAGYPSHSRGR